MEIRIRYDKKTYYVNTDIKVRGRELRDGRIAGRKDADALNERLAIVYDRVMKAVNRCIETNRPIDVKAVKDEAYNIEAAMECERTAMLDWIEEQVPLLNICAGTRRRYEVLVNRMHAYGRLLSWRDLNVEALYDFDRWLHDIDKAQSNGDRQAGAKPRKIGDAAVYNYHRTLRSMLTRAVKFGKIDANPYDRVRGEFRKGIKENVEYLSESEIAAIESLHPMAGTQPAMARDLFVFQMYTGLSYSDAQAFNIADYKQQNGRWVHVGNRIKTGVAYVSDLLPQAVDVLKRYNMEVPKIGNVQYNLSLKDIQKALGIRTRLHSHLARHTFATRMLAFGAKLENVSKALGHTNTRQTERYAKTLAESVHNDYAMFEEKLSKLKDNEKDVSVDVRGFAGGSL